MGRLVLIHLTESLNELLEDKFPPLKTTTNDWFILLNHN